MPDEQREIDHVHVNYEGADITGEPGERLLDIILNAGIDHRHICGGRGFCTSCRIEVVGNDNGLSPVSSLERERLYAQAGTLRLACQTRVFGSTSVKVPVPNVSRFSPFDDDES
jgi:ferredoxin